MARYVGDIRVATCIFEAAAWHNVVRVVCRCGHAAPFDPHGLWWWFQQRHWNDTFREARMRFYCRRCSAARGRRVRPVLIETSQDRETILLPLPDKLVWKKALRRYRT